MITDVAQRMIGDADRLGAAQQATQQGATVPADRNAPYDKGALAALKREEVKAARADLACEEREITPVELEIRPEYEEQFRNRNTKLIEQVRPVSQ